MPVLFYDVDDNEYETPHGKWKGNPETVIRGFIIHASAENEQFWSDSIYYGAQKRSQIFRKIYETLQTTFASWFRDRYTARVELVNRRRRLVLGAAGLTMRIVLKEEIVIGIDQGYVFESNWLPEFPSRARVDAMRVRIRQELKILGTLLPWVDGVVQHVLSMYRKANDKAVLALQLARPLLESSSQFLRESAGAGAGAGAPVGPPVANGSTQTREEQVFEILSQKSYSMVRDAILSFGEPLPQREMSLRDLVMYLKEVMFRKIDDNPYRIRPGPLTQAEVLQMLGLNE